MHWEGKKFVLVHGLIWHQCHYIAFKYTHVDLEIPKIFPGELLKLTTQRLPVYRAARFMTDRVLFL